MHLKLKNGLKAAVANGQVIRIIRRPKSKLPHWEGFVVGLSDAMVVLHDVFIDGFALNGYKCFRQDDIVSTKAIGALDKFVGRAVLLCGLEPVPPEEIDCSSMVSLLRTAGAAFPLVTVHFENTLPDICYVGKVIKVGRKWLTLHKITPGAKWHRVSRFRIKDITRVDFDGGYERMLHLVNKTYHAARPADNPNPTVL